MVTAERTRRITAHLDLSELRFTRVKVEQAVGQGLADTQHKLQGLGRLNRSDDPGEDANHARFLARRDQPRRWRGFEHASIARGFLWDDRGDAPIEPQDASVN